MPQKKGTPHKSPNHPIDRTKKYVKRNVFAHGQTKFEPEELETLMWEYIKYTFDSKGKKLCSVAGFIVWLMMEKFMHLSEMTFYDYIKHPKKDFKFLKKIKMVQRMQLEERSMGIMGMPAPIMLMMKNVGYEDKVVNENVEMPNFDFSKPAKPKKEKEK